MQVCVQTNHKPAYRSFYVLPKTTPFSNKTESVKHIKNKRKKAKKEQKNQKYVTIIIDTLLVTLYNKSS